MTERLKSLAGWCCALAIIYVFWRYVLLDRTSRVFLAPPSRVWDELYDGWTSGDLASRSWRTLSTASLGLLLGGTAGVVSALLVSRSRIRRVADPIVVGTYAMPKIVLVPLLFLWFGRGLWPRVGFVSLGAFAILYLHTATGLRTVPALSKNSLLLMGASDWQVSRLLTLPHSRSHVAAGISVAGPFALVTALVIELLLGRDGLGGRLAIYAAEFDAAGVLSIVLVATVLGLGMSAAGRLLVAVASPGAGSTRRNQ